jgi:CPA1 family monovalent cation:H+ antiporter
VDVLWQIIGLVLGVLAVSGLALRWRLPAPILLLVVGFGVSFIPGVPDYDVDPEIVLFILLPPLLYGAAVDSGVVALKRLIAPILRLAFGMVLITAFAVAVVLQWVVPEVPFAAAVALGAIVAPPDAVAAVAVGRKVGLPRNVMTILEGESLLNDATSLITLRVSLVAVAVGSFAWSNAIREFAWAVVGGVLAGLALGWLVSFVRRRVATPLTVTSLSLVTPFAAYLIGEEIGASGVLAVVVTGLFLGFRAPTDVPGQVRLVENATWSTLRFLLEGAVFALIGLELWEIVDDLDTSATHVVMAIVAVLLTVLLVRPAWLFLTAGLYRLIGQRRRPPDPSHYALKSQLVVSWAGMRGVVSLAAAQSLPLTTPFRSLLLTCTVAVIVGTLVLQGLSLPWLIRTVNLPGDPEAELEAEKALARAEAHAAMVAKIDQLGEDGSFGPHEVAMMKRMAAMWDLRDSDDPRAVQLNSALRKSQNWRKEIMTIQRQVFVQLRNEGRVSEEVMRDLQLDLDLQEALMEGRNSDLQGGGDLTQTMIPTRPPGPGGSRFRGRPPTAPGRPPRSPDAIGGPRSPTEPPRPSAPD